MIVLHATAMWWLGIEKAKYIFDILLLIMIRLIFMLSDLNIYWSDVMVYLHPLQDILFLLIQIHSSHMNRNDWGSLISNSPELISCGHRGGIKDLKKKF